MLDEVTLDDTWLMADAPNKGDEALFVRFRMHPKKDQTETEKQGRPIFKSIEYVSISSPGDKFNGIDRPATLKDKRRFKRQYQAFKENQGDILTGTPLAHWPLMDAAQVEELKYFNIRTVEQLAAMPDGNIPNVGNISHLKKHAVDYLAVAKGNAPTIQLRAELEKRDNMLEAMQRQMAEQAKELARLSARHAESDESPEPAKRGPGRPKKASAQETET
jgi:hypothetical protein